MSYTHFPFIFRNLLLVLAFVWSLAMSSWISAACMPPYKPPLEELTDEQLEQLKASANEGNAQALYRLSLRMPRHDTSLTGYSGGCGRNQEWIDTLIQAAEKGYAPAQYDMGVGLYKQGRTEYGSIDSNLYQIRCEPPGFQEENLGVESGKWLEKAAQQGYAPAYYALGIHYAERDPDQALEWLMKSATSGNQDAITRLSEIKAGQLKLSYWYDKKATYNWLVRQLQTGAENIDPAEAMYQASQYIPNPQNSFSNLPCESGSESGDYLDKLYWRYKAAALGQQQALSDIIKHDPFFKCKYRAITDETFQRRDKIASSENCISVFRIKAINNRTLEELLVVLESSHSAKILSPRDKLELAYYYERSPQAEQKSRAIQIYRDLVKQKNPDAMYRLGVAFDIGNGVEQNEAEALHWYWQAVIHMKHPGIHGFPPQSLRNDARAAGDKGYIKFYDGIHLVDRLNRLSAFFTFRNEFNKDAIAWLEYMKDKGASANEVYTSKYSEFYYCGSPSLRITPELAIAYLGLAELYLNKNNALSKDDEKIRFYLLKAHQIPFSHFLLDQKH